MSAARNMVISVRLDQGSVHVLDLLVDSGVAKSRSEATARLVQIGIGASSSLLEHVREIANTTLQLREEFGSIEEVASSGNAGVRPTSVDQLVDISEESGDIEESDQSSAENEHDGSDLSGAKDGSDDRDGASVGGDGAPPEQSNANDDDFIRPYREAIETTRAKSSQKEFDVFVAASIDFPDRMVEMIEQDPELLHAHDENGWTALHIAALFDCLRTTIALVSDGADMSARSNNELRATPLHAAAFGWNRVSADILLLRGADPNAKQSNGWTPLHIAAFHGNEILIEMLLQYGADPSIRSLKGETPFDIAMKYGRNRVATRLSRAQAGRR